MIKPYKTIKFVTWLTIFALAVTIMTIILGLFWLYQSNPIYKFKDYPIPVRTIRNPAPPGGVVILEANYCKLTSGAGQVRTSFVSTTREVFLPMGEERAKKGCYDTEIPIIIPKDLAPDTYKVHFVATYKLNPLKSTKVELYTKEFQVVGD